MVVMIFMMMAKTGNVDGGSDNDSVDGGVSGDAIDGGGGIGCSGDCVDSVNGSGDNDVDGMGDGDGVYSDVGGDANNCGDRIDGGGNGGDSEAISAGGMAEVFSITTAHTLPGKRSASEVSPCLKLWLLRDMPSRTLYPGSSPEIGQ